MIADGKTNRSVAYDLSISVQTVRTHVSNILAKLEAPNRSAAAAKYQQLQAVRACHRDTPPGVGEKRSPTQIGDSDDYRGRRGAAHSPVWTCVPPDVPTRTRIAECCSSVSLR